MDTLEERKLWGKKRYALVFGGAFILYNLLSGGGCIIERTDSLSTLDGVAIVQLTDDISVRLSETPTTKNVSVPFFFYYVNRTYPFRLLFCGSTPGEFISVEDKKSLAWINSGRLKPRWDKRIVVTEVRYYRQSVNGASASVPPTVFTASSWNDIIIPEPGEWTVESKGYMEVWKGETKQMIFPTMTIHPTKSGDIDVQGFLWHELAQPWP